MFLYKKGLDDMMIMPEGEKIRKTVRWISERRQSHPEENLERLLQQACLNFDLPPKDAEFLRRFLWEKQ
jgi:hypothetical protein